MSRTLLLLLVLVWCACGYVNYGLTLGYFTNRFPEADHFGFALLTAFGGPFALPASLAATPHHWRTKRLTVDERWEYFHKDNPMLDRDEFNHVYN